ncbi:MAG: ROK family protein [Gammaproteobacteria bacterium]
MRIGIDLGGTKIEIAALDDQGRETLRRRVATPRGDYDATLRAIVELIRTAEVSACAPASVGVAIPGAISPATGAIKNANSTWLIGRKLDEDLSRALHRPVRLANDADCFALSEAGDGAAAGARTVFGVILGTGCGGGIVVEGRLLAGPNAIAGEWGHNPLPWPGPEEQPGPACYCGKQGCIETWLSGPGLQADHERSAGSARTGRDIVADAERGDPSCRATLERYMDRLARGLASVINVIDPEVIVLGGGLSNIDALYTGVPDRWGRYVFSDRVDTRLVRALHGDSSGVRGAAWLWPLEG